MKIGIVGGGSIGLLVSSFLHKQHDVTIYVRRSEQKTALNAHGLLLSGNSNSLPVRALLLEEMKDEELLIICVKQLQVPSVLGIVKMTHKHTPLLFLQNGMGHIKYLEAMKNPLFVGVVEHGALRENDHHVHHTGNGIIKLATFNGKHETLVYLTEQLNQSIFPIEMKPEWKQLLSYKLIVNAVINPLTALFNVSNGTVLDNPHIRKLAQKLCLEAAEILDLDYLEQWNRVEKIAKRTSENQSSMLTDLKRKQQTEIEAISGYLIGLSKRNIPYTSFVYNSIKALEVEKWTGKEYV